MQHLVQPLRLPPEGALGVNVEILGHDKLLHSTCTAICESWARLVLEPGETMPGNLFVLLRVLREEICVFGHVAAIRHAARGGTEITVRFPSITPRDRQCLATLIALAEENALPEASAQR